MLGRIEVIKMNVLPKYMFLFQNLPVILKKNLFQELNKLTSGWGKFIWVGKKTRIRFKYLQDDKARGGLTLQHLIGENIGYTK